MKKSSRSNQTQIGLEQSAYMHDMLHLILEAWSTLNEKAVSEGTAIFYLPAEYANGYSLVHVFKAHPKTWQRVCGLLVSKDGAPVTLKEANRMYREAVLQKVIVPARRKPRRRRR